MGEGLDFNYVLAKISSKEPLILNQDVVLGGFLESRQFRDGIEIKKDNVVIDGNGHSIDARGEVRIFNILANKVTLKNIHFKNGFHKKFGGAIRNAGECRIIDCTFENNHAGKSGNDISNGSEMFVSYMDISDNNKIHNVGSINLLKEEKERMMPLISGGNVSDNEFIAKYDVTINVLSNGSVEDTIVRIGSSVGVTDEFGICVLNDIEEGNHSVEIIHDDYGKNVEKIFVSSKNLSFNINISGKYDVKFLIEGSKGPIDGAIVKMGNIANLTNVDGICSLNGVDAGPQPVEVRVDNFGTYIENIVVSNKTTFFNISFNDESFKANLPFQPSSRKEPYIFASYAHKDADKVYPELLTFHDGGLNIWYDEGITSGSGWQEVVEDAILESSLFIVFITPNSVESENVREEIFLALDQKIPMIPIYLQQTELKYGLKLRLQNVQSIWKFELPYDRYIERCIKDFASFGFEFSPKEK